MTSQVSVQRLFKHFQHRLALRWVSGEGNSTRQLIDQEPQRDIEIVGHMNPVRAHRIQCLGRSELDYIEQLPADTRSRLINRVCVPSTAILMIADSGQAPPDLVIAAKARDIAVFGSSLSCNILISETHYYLVKHLALREIHHGVFMEVLGIGVLITGKSAVGKSELALELINRGSRLIADDAPEFVRESPDTIAGICPDTLKNFLEVRGLGILNIAAMFGDSAVKTTKHLRLIIHLSPLDDLPKGRVNRLNGSRSTQKVLDVDIPKIELPVAPGRNLAVLVEAAARNHTLIRRGYDASQDFIDRQQRKIQENGQ